MMMTVPSSRIITTRSSLASAVAGATFNDTTSIDAGTTQAAEDRLAIPVAEHVTNNENKSYFIVLLFLSKM